VQPTHLSEARRQRHEAAGEWPQHSLASALESRVRSSPDATYLIEAATGRHYSFRALRDRALTMAAALRQLGVRRGDVVSWQLPNWFEAPALAVAIDWIGAVSNPIITMYRERELRFICRQAGTRVLVVPGCERGVDHRELARAARAASPGLEHILTIRATPGDGMQALETLEAQVGPAPRTPPTPAGSHDVSMLFYTSGTTADPKGVLHTPSTLGAMVSAHGACFAVTPADRALLQFPLPHVGGVLMFVMSQVWAGSSVVFMEQFDPTGAVEAIARYGVTRAGGPPVILRGILGAPNLTPDSVRTLRTSGAGAADVSAGLMRDVERALDVIAYRSYGMTECPMVTSGVVDDPIAQRHESDGRPLPGCTVRAVNAAGRVVPPGVEGELEIQGPQLCVGYLDPDLNGAFTSDGALRTGDLGVVDGAGYVRITGRRKDVIIRKGETLSAREIEDVLARHPQIAEAVVVGLPDPERGELVCACVVPVSSAPLSLHAVRAFMEAQGMMRQKIPERLELMAQLPRNATGKIQKHILRAGLSATPVS